jgi:cation transport ATPase
MSLFRLKNVLQLLGAGLFVFFSLGSSVFFISRFFPDALPAWIVVPLLVIGFFVFVFLAMVLFHGKRPRRISPEKWAARIRKFEEDGLLIHQTFRARRAFQVDEFEDEGSSYFVELEDLSVLFLTGQYLYDYEPLKSRSSATQLRSFPATEFTIRRHKENGFVVDILCHGTVLEPEALAPWFDENDFKNEVIPKDGTVIRDKTYDQIKRERLKQQ